MQGQNLTLKPFLYIRSCSSYSLHSLHTKNLPQITRINTDFSFLKNICEICGRTFICCMKGNTPQITQINTDFCYSGTSVNICGICGKTFISCLKGILPQITRIHTDFCFLKNICEYLWNLRENIHILLER